MFVRTVVLLVPPPYVYLPPYLFAFVLCNADEDNAALTHTVECLQEEISASQTHNTKQYPPQFMKLVSTELINQRGVRTCTG